MKKAPKKRFLAFQKGVKNIQTACTVPVRKNIEILRSPTGNGPLPNDKPTFPPDKMSV